jgi:bifunctional DNA-binding transcriptional regulator/antitoxin component of YhaV-PrlF toxin-antitoxin module
MKEILTDVRREGQVVIPEEVREYFGPDARGQVAFVITDEGTVQLHTLLAEIIGALRGATGSLDRPLLWERIEEIMREDRADQTAKKLGVSRSRWPTGLSTRTSSSGDAHGG